MITPEESKWIRVTKPTAKRLYESGIRVNVVPCNFRPNNGWLSAYPIPENIDFDKFVRDFTIYNCINRETGKYPSFYVANSNGGY